MKEIFLIIQTGYEGIEDLGPVTFSETDAVLAKHALEDKLVQDEIEQRKAMNEYWTKEGHPENVESLELSEKEKQGIKDFACIQKWQGSGWKCVCGELAVSPSQPMFR